MKKTLLAVILIVLCFFSGYTLSKGHKEKKAAEAAASASASAASYASEQMQAAEADLFFTAL